MLRGVCTHDVTPVLTVITYIFPIATTEGFPYRFRYD